MTSEPTLKNVLVVGHPRSGTGYLARLLQAYGVAVGHERMEADGISSWMFAAVTTRVPYGYDGAARASYSFRHTIHVVRHPLAVIASTAYTESKALEGVAYMARFIVVERTAGVFERACRTYLGWNKLIDAQAPTLRVRVETAPDVVPRFLQERGLYRPPQPQPDLPATDYNSRRHPPLTANELRLAVPGSLWLELLDYVESLGYGNLDRM